jgi:hypothetical protein
MATRRFFNRLFLSILLLFSRSAAAPAADAVASAAIDWNKVVRVSRTTPTLQVVVNPQLRRGASMHDAAFRTLHDLGCDLVRYVPWLPYPKLAVAELDPPRDGKTFWDFSLIDPVMADFMDATAGHSVVINFSAIPQWMYKTPQPVPYPVDPDQVTWNYEQGTELRDPTRKELAGYYQRLVSWYTQGGFKDEFGKWHGSDHHYKIDYWEVFNEVDDEHSMTPQEYTASYDAIVEAIRQVAPHMKFVALALDETGHHPEFFEYFLNPRHHKPGIPLDMVSYHFYASPTADQSPEVQQYTFFDQMDGFLNVVRYVDSIRERLSPRTQTDVNELGAISGDDRSQNLPGHVTKPIPNSYWNLSAALYAYAFGEMARMGIEAVGESQLVGYPTQYPSVSLVDWALNKPNARAWVLKLLRENFGPGDKLAASGPENQELFIQGFVTRDGRHKVLLVNKRDRTQIISIPGATGGSVAVVDQETAFEPPAHGQLRNDQVTLGGLAVAVVTLAQ